MKGGDAVKQILWISRHEMTLPQRADLERVMDGPARLLPWQDTVRDIADLQPLLQKADAAAAVLPLELPAKLVEMAGEKPVLRAVCSRTLTGRMAGRSRRRGMYISTGSRFCGWRCGRKGCKLVSKRFLFAFLDLLIYSHSHNHNLMRLLDWFSPFQLLTLFLRSHH